MQAPSAAPEERKRGAWGGQGRNQAGAAAGSKQGAGAAARGDSKTRGMGAKKPSVGGFGGGAAAKGDPKDAMANMISPDNKRKKQEDWNYLK